MPQKFKAKSETESTEQQSQATNQPANESNELEQMQSNGDVTTVTRSPASVFCQDKADMPLENTVAGINTNKLMLNATVNHRPNNASNIFYSYNRLR